MWLDAQNRACRHVDFVTSIGKLHPSIRIWLSIAHADLSIENVTWVLLRPVHKCCFQSLAPEMIL